MHVFAELLNKKVKQSKNGNHKSTRIINKTLRELNVPLTADHVIGFSVGSLPNHVNVYFLIKHWQGVIPVVLKKKGWKPKCQKNRDEENSDKQEPAEEKNPRLKRGFL
jgi:hypothetical protein